MPRLLHIADLHLGWQPRRLSDERARVRRARRDALLAGAVDVALAEGVHAVVVAGDLFDTFDPEPAVVEGAIAQLTRLRDAGVEVVTVPGNHDELTYARSVYRVHAERWPGTLVTCPMPERVATWTWDGTEVTVSGVAYVGGVTDVRRVTDDLPRADGDALHVFVAHGTLSGASGATGERSLPLPQAALAAAGYDYVALGHIHVPGRVPLGRGLGVYPGCVGGTGLDDVGSTGWTIVDLHAGRPPAVRTVPAGAQRVAVERVDVTTMDDEAAVLAALEALADADALVRLELTGVLPFPLDVAALEERVRAGFFHLELRDETLRVSDALLDAWSEGRTVMGTFVRRMRARLDAAEDDDERRRASRALLLGVRALREGA